ncbi:MAG: ribosomal protein S18-alanine N-acetyltransferase [Terracidiphilus sp.]|jgi:ribosomal-protein-alanine N-acetyltransferase
MKSTIHDLRIRRMSEADVARVMEIAGGLESAPHWPREAFLRALDPEAMPKRIALVAESDNAVAGFAVAILLPPEAELELIAAAAEAQRQGVATRLFESLAEELRADQIQVVVLEVRASNAPALAFYRRLGFAETGRRVRYYVDPVEDALLMRRELGWC